MSAAIANECKRIYTLVNVYYDIQKIRIVAGNRFLGAKRDGWMSEEEADIEYKRMEDRLKAYEKELAKDIKTFAFAHPIWDGWLERVRGVAEILSGGLLANIGDIEKFDSVSKLWAYAGLHTIQASTESGKRWFPSEAEANVFAERFVERAKLAAERKDKTFTKAQATTVRNRTLKGICWGDEHEIVQVAAKRRKGQPANWNHTLKTLCWKIADSFVKCGGPYRVQYDKFKAQDRAKHPIVVESDKKDRDGKPVRLYTDGHIDARAKRKTVKLFLSHLWQVWRELEGLSTRQPYAQEYLKHSTISDPESFTGN